MGELLKKYPQTPSKLSNFHCVWRAKKCSGFFCLALGFNNFVRQVGSWLSGSNADKLQTATKSLPT